MSAFVISNRILAGIQNTSNLTHMKKMKNEVMRNFRFLRAVGLADFGQRQDATIAGIIASSEILSHRVPQVDVNLLQTQKWNSIFLLNLPIKILGMMSV